jgi:hypothetical protein
VRGVVRRDQVEDLAQDPPLDVLEPRFGLLDQPRRGVGTVLPAIA